MKKCVLIFLLYFALRGAEYSYELMSKPLTELQASLKVEYTSRFPHFVQELTFEQKGAYNKISYDTINGLYSLHLDGRKFTTKALTINHKEKEVVWAGRYTQKYVNDAWLDDRRSVNLMLGCLRHHGIIEMRPGVLNAEVVALKNTPNNKRLISLYQVLDTMIIRSLDIEKKRCVDFCLDSPVMAFDIACSSKYLIAVDERGMLFRGYIKNLLGMYWQTAHQLKNVCYGYDDDSLLALSDCGAHFIGFVKCKSTGIWTDCPRTCASLKGRFKNVWRGTGIDSFVVQDGQGQYHELTLKRPVVTQDEDNKTIVDCSFDT